MRWVDNPVETTARLGESGCCVHVGDREADIYELVCASQDVGAHFVIRSAYPQLVEEGTTKTDAQLQEVRLKGLPRITVRPRSGLCAVRGRARTAISDEMRRAMSDYFDDIYAADGVPPIPPETLLKGRVPQAL